MRFSNLLVGVLIFAASVQAQARFWLINGIKTKKYPAVIETSIGCTATIIGRGTLITAYHCVDGILPIRIKIEKRGANFVKIALNFHDLFEVGGVSYKGTAIYIPKNQFDKSRINPALDLVIVKFTPAKIPAGISPLPISLNIAKKGAGVTMIGFGRNQNDNQNNSTNGYGVKRLGTNRISSMNYGMISIVGRFKNKGISDGRSTSISQGDSGGPLLLRGKIVGIASQQLSFGIFPRQILSKYVDLSSKEVTKFLREIP